MKFYSSLTNLEFIKTMNFDKFIISYGNVLTYKCLNFARKI
jgi:hypothetical protein